MFMFCVISGVPQGSVLGPLLFIVYSYNDLPEVVQSNIAIFANDTKLYTVDLSLPLTIVANTLLSNNFDLLVEWYRVWQMKFN